MGKQQLSKLKPEFKDHFVAFGGKGKINLGDREDLDDLALIARQSGNPNLTRLFEHLPSLEELQKAKTDEQLKNGPQELTQTQELLDENRNPDPNGKNKAANGKGSTSTKG
jgi:hypothetical protein